MLQKNRHKNFFYFAISFAILFLPAFNALAEETSLFPGISKDDSIDKIIISIYTYATGIVGILATIVIMFGGFIWLSSFGNPGRVKEAQEWIKAAITGLVLVMFSYVILWIINPDLVNPHPLQVPKVDLSQAGGTGAGTPDQASKQACTTSDTCPDGFRCDISGTKTCSIDERGNCIASGSCGLPGEKSCCGNCNPNTNTCESRTPAPNDCPSCVKLTVPTKDGAWIQPAIASKLNTAYQDSSNQNWRVTEACPPTGYHTSGCHYNCSCVDLNFTYKPSRTEIQTLYDTLVKDGLFPYYEMPTSCAGYENVNCRVINRNPPIIPHFHVENKT